MSVLTSGSVIVAPRDDFILIPDGLSLKWLHDLGKRALSVQVLDEGGNNWSPPDVTVTQSDDAIVVLNGTGSDLNATLIVTWEVGTVGAAGVIPSTHSDLSVT